MTHNILIENITKTARIKQVPAVIHSLDKIIIAFI